LAEHFLIKEKMDEEFLRNLRINNWTFALTNIDESIISKEYEFFRSSNHDL
jgi:hypothetical protein